MDNGANGGSALGGCFLFAMGLCLLFAGGSCAYGTVTSMFIIGFHSGSIIGLFMGLLIPGAFIAAGISLIRNGLRRMG
jgi:hypothetical protein